VKDVDALDRRRADDLRRKLHRYGTRADDVAHERLARVARAGLLLRHKLRVLCKSSDRLGERAAQVDIKPCAGGAVMVPAPQRLKQCVARELRHQVAGEPADRAEGRGPGARGAGPPLVIVAMAHDPDAVAQLEGIVQEPLERAPGGMHLDGALDPAVVRMADIGVAPADMRDDDGVLACERAEELIRREDGNGRGPMLDQNVR